MYYQAARPSGAEFIAACQIPHSQHYCTAGVDAELPYSFQNCVYYNCLKAEQTNDIKETSCASIV